MSNDILESKRAGARGWHLPSGKTSRNRERVIESWQNGQDTEARRGRPMKQQQLAFAEADTHVDENSMAQAVKLAIEPLSAMPLDKKIAAINAIREVVAKHSPFSSEPVDCVRWVPAELVTANDYNPNSVAPPEMKLLEHSIREDGYTQPIVSWHRDDLFEVVDGFHRHRVGKESLAVKQRVHGYLPLVVINQDRQDKCDRIASTIRHNRARGKHKVEAMSDIVTELKRRNWSDSRIAKELGMDEDEVLRLCQITGLSDVFKDKDFSEAWEADKVDDDYISLRETGQKPQSSRVYHTYEKWECYRHGFYSERPPNGMTVEQGELAYQDFLSDILRFENALERVISEWKHSCQHYLTNDRMNRVAWLGQAAMCLDSGIPRMCRAGYSRMTESQQSAADQAALKALNKWLSLNGREPATMEEATGRTDAELY